MKSNQRLLLLLAVLALLGAGTWWLSRRAARTNSTLDVAATTFSVSDTAAVDKIFVALRSGEQHTLTRVARNYWRLDNRYDARLDMVQMLLTTIARQRVKAPVPRAARNSVVRALAGNGTKVEVYQQGQRATTFYVGGATNDRLGTYMILEGAKDPYVIHIPGFEGYLTTRFLLTPRDWRSIPIFTTLLPALQRIEVVAAGAPARTFAVARTAAGSFAIADFPKADSLLLKSYATQFSSVFGQVFVDSASRPAVDSIMRRPPGFVVTVRRRGPGPPERIRLWPIKDNPDAMIGRTDRDSTEAMLVQVLILDRILVGRTDFVRKK